MYTSYACHIYAVVVELDDVLVDDDVDVELDVVVEDELLVDEDVEEEEDVVDVVMVLPSLS